MAANKNRNSNELRFKLNDEDYNAFGRYRILYTKGGRKIVNRQRFTYFFSGAMIALLFTVFHVDPAFTKLAYAVAAIIGIGGPLLAEKIILRQQARAISASADTAERVHPVENIIRFGDETFETEDHQTFRYSDIKLIDLTEEAIYVWMSDSMIMPIPQHCFKGMPEMKEMYNWIREKIKEQGGKVEDE